MDLEIATIYTVLVWQGCVICSHLLLVIKAFIKQVFIKSSDALKQSQVIYSIFKMVAANTCKCG